MMGAGIGSMMSGVGSWLLDGLMGGQDAPSRPQEMVSSTWTPQRREEFNREMDRLGIHDINERIRRADEAIAAERVNDPRFAEHHLQKLPGIGEQYFNPFIQQGQEAQGLASEQYNKMTSNPMDYLGSIVESYKPSQGYQFREKRATDAARNAAAAGGLTGTYNDQASQAELVNNLLGADMQEYLANVLGIQGAGLQGQENAMSRGFGASGNLANYLGDTVGAQAGLASNREQQQYARDLDYQNAMAEHEAGLRAGVQNMMGSFFGGMGGMAGGGAGGMGGGMGGDMGGLGSMLGGLLGGGGMSPQPAAPGNARSSARRGAAPGSFSGLGLTQPLGMGMGRRSGGSVYGGFR